jgi:rod shape-determining protein MreC
VLFLIALTAITLVTLDSRAGDSGPIGFVGRIAHQIVDPVARLTDRVMTPVQDWFDGVVDSGGLRTENKDLRRELAELRAMRAEYEAAIRDDAILKALSGQPYLDAIDSKVGRVVQFEPGNFERTVTLDIGRSDGIEPGMPVVADGGLLGKVLESWSGGSKVLLLVDDRFGVGVSMLRAPEEFAVGFADGVSNSNDLKVEFTLDTSEMKEKAREGAAVVEGDPVVTSGTGSEFPPNIPVGEVSVIQRGEQDLFLRVRISPYADLEALKYVKVLLWQADDQVPDDLLELPELPDDTSSTLPIADSSSSTTTTTTTTPTVPESPDTSDSASTDGVSG